MPARKKEEIRSQKHPKDGNKKLKGRKRHIVVDTQVYPVAVSVHEAHIHNGKGAPKVIEKMSCKFSRLSKILRDGGYRGNLADWVLDKYGWKLEIVLRPDECPSKFKIIPKHRIMERTFACLENYRRLTIDYEFHVTNGRGYDSTCFLQNIA